MPSVLFVSPTAETGGSDQALLRLVRDLEADFSCHVAVPAEPPLRAAFEAAGARVHVVPMRRITTTQGRAWWLRYALEWPLTVLRLVALVRRVRADVVSSNSLHSWYGWAAAALTRRPHVWHAREIVVQSGAALRLERALVGRFATLLVSCSYAAERQFADVVPAARRVVVHEDVDRSRWRPDNAGAFRERLGIGADVPLVGFAGRIDTWKGVDVLLDAWPLVRERVPGAELVVAGGPVQGKEAYYERLRGRAATMPGVHWLGAVSDMPDLVADLDVLAAPSTLPEPYGLVIVEALASGTPVVATREGGPPEILARAAPHAGRLVDAGDAAGLAAAAVTVLRASRSGPPVALLPPQPVGWPAIYGRVAVRRSVVGR